MMSDPYEEDFYNQIFQTLVRKRMVAQSTEGAPPSNGRNESGRRSGRRQNAMQRMEQQVERIINNVRLREREKDLHCAFHFDPQC
jgi:DNA topoisomerase 2-associated protein PAT1